MAYTQAFMNALRPAGDELADATVATLFERGEVGKFNTLMRYVSTAGQELPEGLPEVAREYLHETSAPPAWVDWDEMEKARLFFIDNNVHISTALSFASMPACYLVPHVAKLLSATHCAEVPVQTDGGDRAIHRLPHAARRVRGRRPLHPRRPEGPPAARLHPSPPHSAKTDGTPPVWARRSARRT